MKTVTEWLGQYSQVCENLLAVLVAEPVGYSDEKLASFEAAIEIRQELLDELAGLEIRESEKPDFAAQLEALRNMESEIESQVKTMMSELDTERQTVHDQRSELNRLKKANRSYAGTARSTEGYFIDKKK